MYPKGGIVEFFGGYYYVINALGATPAFSEGIEELKEPEPPYWVKNLECVAT